MFRFHDPSGRCPLHDEIRAKSKDNQTYKHSNPDPQKCQPHDSSTEAVDRLEDEGNRREEEIEVTIDDRHEDRKEQHNGGEKKHLRGPHNRVLEQRCRRHSIIVLRTQGLVTRFPAEASGFSFEKSGSVAFTQDENHGYGTDTSLNFQVSQSSTVT